MFRGRFHNSVVVAIACITIAMSFCGYASAQEVEPPYSYPIAVGSTFCSANCPSGIYPTMCELSLPIALFSAPSPVPDNLKFGWTSLLSQPGSTSEYGALMCAGIPYQDICASGGIWGVPGTSTATMRNLESLMFDPSFDAANKEKDISGNVTGWWTLLPQTMHLDPMSPPDPNPVIGHVLTRIIAVCALGISGCRAFDAPPGLCSAFPVNSVVIDRISCLPCSGTPNLHIMTQYPINFGEVNVGDSSTAQEVRILNAGSNILYINEVDITGSDSSEFTIQSNDCSVRLLMPSSECTIQLGFSPTNGGQRNATLAISSNDPYNPVTEVSLNGWGMVPSYNLSVTNIMGSGSVSAIGIACPADCSETYNSGTNVELTANPDSGWYFDYWGGDISGDANPYSLLIDANKSITAAFQEIDTDGDGVPDSRDNCPLDQNPDQSDMDSDGKGDVCDTCPNDEDNDIDSDGICGDTDNCPNVSNSNQLDSDADGIGDACDTCPYDKDNDIDGDGVCSNIDNCPNIANPGQSDADQDGIGDDCDICPHDSQNDIDSDGVCGDTDNCPSIANSNQANSDGDGLGDVCDPCPFDSQNDIDAGWSLRRC